jgi:hypothetical protein
MPILPILRILLFSAVYKFTNISSRQNVTNVVKNYVKKLSVGGLGIEKSGLSGVYQKVSWGTVSGVRFSAAGGSGDSGQTSACDEPNGSAESKTDDKK